MTIAASQCIIADVTRVVPAEISRLSPSDKGAYVLEFHIVDPICLTVEKLGSFKLDPGWYYYVGSALNGLRGRLRRHILGKGKLHWHIDYLAGALAPSRIWYVFSIAKLESEIVKLVSGKCSSAIPGFGAGDSPRHKTHLFYSEKPRNFLSDLCALGKSAQVELVAD